MKIKFLLFSFLCTNNFLFAHEFQTVHAEKTVASIKKEIEQPYFITEVLPYDFSSMIFLLKEGKILHEEKYAYFRSVMKMYMNFIKQTAFIDAEHFLILLKELSSIIMPESPEYMIGISKIHYNNYQHILYDQLLSSFSTQYDVFKNGPKTFLEELSNNLTKNIIKSVEYIEFEQQYVRFIEIACTKLLWNPLNIKDSWELIKKTAQEIHVNLEKKTIRDPNNIDDILWSLVTRYGYFLDMFYDEISLQTLQNIKKEIDTGSLSLFSYDTQAGNSKRDYLKNTFSSCIMQKNTKVL